jgi:hypothetical protein
MAAGSTEWSHQLPAITTEWETAFTQMRRYFEHEAITSYRIAYDPATWYRFKNPALIYPEERVMRFATPNAALPFDYYPSRDAKLGIVGHNFAYLADLEEYYPYNFPGFLGEQQEFVTPLQRANLRAAHFIPDALVAVTREGLRSFLRARGEVAGLGSYEEPLVIMETLGLMGMPRHDDPLTFFKEISETEPSAINAFFETPYIFSFAGLATPPALNADLSFGIHGRAELAHVKALVHRYVHAELPVVELRAELQRLRYTLGVQVAGYKPEESVDLRWVKLDAAIDRVKQTIAAYEHKAAHATYACYACYEDMVTALRRIYEREAATRRSYL